MTGGSATAPGRPAPLPTELFRSRRERLLASLGSDVAILAAAPALYRSRDTEVEYRPDSDLYYLTGLEEPEAVAVLAPHERDRRFTMFVRPRDPEREVWNGPRLGVEGVVERCGADAVYPIAELAARLPDLVLPGDGIVYALGADEEIDRLVGELIRRGRRARPRSGKGPMRILDPDPILGPMRLVKDGAEIERMRVAGRIAAQGHRAVMAAARAGVGEWELEAVLESTFRSRGADGPAFASIVGSGPNATVLHYVSNSRTVADGDLVLVDAGAAWGLYCSDITRTFPVSGRFSPAQREVYEVVLAAGDAAIAAARPGAAFTDVHDAAVRVLVEGLLRLGILSGGEPGALVEQGAYKRFYMHQTSHWLGLDVHDAGPYRLGGEPVRLAPGMVLTVEPGLYLPAEAADVPERYRGIGVRLEDDVLVTEAGPEVLTRDVPVTVEEVEALVGSAR